MNAQRIAQAAFNVLIKEEDLSGCQAERLAQAIAAELAKPGYDLAAELVRVSHLGLAPLVLYDDNGNWCIADEGIAEMRTEDHEDFSMQVWGQAAWFRPSPQEAWECYLQRMRELGNDV